MSAIEHLGHFALPVLWDGNLLALSRELVSFLKFNESDRICILHTSPAGFKPELEELMKTLL